MVHGTGWKLVPFRTATYFDVQACLFMTKPDSLTLAKNPTVRKLGFVIHFLLYSFTDCYLFYFLIVLLSPRAMIIKGKRNIILAFLFPASLSVNVNLS
jgi:hypothetical protein